MFSGQRERLLWGVLQSITWTFDPKADTDAITASFEAAARRQPSGWWGRNAFAWCLEIANAGPPHEAYLWAAVLLEIHKRDKTLRALRAGIEAMERRRATPGEARALVQEMML